MATLYKTDGTKSEIRPRSGSAFGLRELQSFVDGYIEMVRLDADRVLIVNEEGRLNGLPSNILASELAGFPIVGNALLCKEQGADLIG